MSLEAALAENTAAVLAHIEVLKQIGVNQERLLAGQSVAIEKVEAFKATRARKKPDDAPAAEPKKNGEPAGTASGAGDAGSVSESTAPTADELFAYASGYLAEFKDKDATKYQERGKFLKSTLASEFGDKKIKELDDETDRKRMMFYLKRFAAGLKVDLAADYNFDGDPTADAGASGDDFEDI